MYAVSTMYYGIQVYIIDTSLRCIIGIPIDYLVSLKALQSAKCADLTLVYHAN